MQDSCLSCRKGINLKSIFLPTFLLFCSSIGSSFAQTPKPAPDVVQRLLATLQHKQALAVAVVQTDDSAGDRPDSAYLEFSQPNKLKLLSRVQGLLVASLVSDGKTVSQWNDSVSMQQTAPATLQDIHRVLPMGYSALMAEKLLVKSGDYQKITDWSDDGPATLKRTPAHKVSAAAEHLTLWLHPDTGLPLQEEVVTAGHTLSFSFSYAKAASAVKAADFTDAPPDGLARYLPPHEAGLLPPGTTAPNFSLTKLDGAVVNLASLKGGVVLVDFWATWCPPCRESMPVVEGIYRDLKGQGLTVLSVNTSDDKDAMQAFLAAHPEYTTTMLFDPNRKPNAVADSYQVTGIPTIYVLDKAGKVVASFVGYEPDEEAKVRLALSYAGL